jgi:hypothetical protein
VIIEFVGGPWDGEIENLPGVGLRTVCVPRWGKRAPPLNLCSTEQRLLDIQDASKWVEYRIDGGMAYYMGAAP